MKRPHPAPGAATVRAAILAALTFAGCASPAGDARRLAEANATGVCHVHRVPMERERRLVLHPFVVAARGPMLAVEGAGIPLAHRPIFGGIGGIEGGGLFFCSRCGAPEGGWVCRHPRHPWAREGEAEMEN